MTIYADLSPSGLLPAAVLRLVQQHADNRPPENILFKVNREVFDLFIKELPKPVAVSQEEANKINLFLGAKATADDFTVTDRKYCTNCGRNFTFYDLFETGRKRHGDAFVRRFLAGGECHIQVAAKTQTIEADCTNCGTRNIIPAESYLHYTGTIGQSAYSYCAAALT
jgi:hypothetical protein